MRYWKSQVIQWHRRLGILVALVIVLSSVTGMALNHTTYFDLAKRSISAPWLLSWYGIKQSQELSFLLGQQWVTWRDGKVFFASQEVADLTEPAQTALYWSPYYLVASGRQMLLFSEEGLLIESIPLPQAVSYSHEPLRLAKEASGDLVLVQGEQYWQADEALLSWRAIDKPAQSLNSLSSETLAEPIQQELDRVQPVASISLERILLDVHSGRFFGKAGVWLMDILAMMLILLALTGLVLWRLRKKKKVRRPRHILSRS